MRRLTWLGAALVLGLLTSTSAARTWTDKSGTYKVEAELVEVADGKVKLKKTDGTVISVSVDVLSQPDQDFLKQQPAAKPAAQPNAPAAAQPAPKPAEAGATKPDEGPKLQMPSEDEAHQFGKEIEQAVRNGNMDAIKAAFDWPLMMARACRGLDIPAAKREECIVRLKAMMMEPGGSLGMLAKKAVRGGAFRMVGIRERAGERQVVFRMFIGRHSYEAWVLTKTAEGRVLVADVYSFDVGEQMSELMRSGLLQAITLQSPAQLGGDLDKQAQIRKLMEARSRIVQQMREGKSAEALATYNELPEPLKKDRQILLVRCTAAKKVSREEYIAAVDALRQVDPNSETVDLLLFDYYAYKKDTTKYRETVDRLTKAIGEDAHLECLRAVTYGSEKNIPKMREGLKRAIRIDPDYIEAQQLLKAFAEAEDTPKPAVPQQ